MRKEYDKFFWGMFGFTFFMFCFGYFWAFVSFDRVDIILFWLSSLFFASFFASRLKRLFGGERE
jgi:hypothetical protein